MKSNQDEFKEELDKCLSTVPDRLEIAKLIPSAVCRITGQQINLYNLCNLSIGFEIKLIPCFLNLLCAYQLPVRPTPPGPIKQSTFSLGGSPPTEQPNTNIIKNIKTIKIASKLAEF